MLSSGSLLLACSSTPDNTTVITRPELVAVSPEDFLGTQKCGDGPGLVGSYVATLFDVTPASDGGPGLANDFPLPSSPPTSCEFPVTFSYVIDDHRYRAEIDAYDRLPQSGASDPDPTHIKPVSTGGRLQQDATGTHVAPRWVATCGGFPATPDAGAPDASDGTDGAEAADASLPGVMSYDTLTATVHNCPGGLVGVK